MLAFIGGTGFLGLGRVLETLDVLTPYGSAIVHRVRMLDEELYFIPRHGDTHSIPPHKVNYKANIHALRKLGAKAVFATYACGVMSKYKPGDLAIARDFISLNTPITFYDDFSGGARHFDFSNPYDKGLVNSIFEIASVQKIKIKDGGIVATTVGPRFETKAEISALKKMGANLVSMTHAYEAVLVNEAEIPFAALAIGTNYAAGVTRKPVDHDEVISNMEKAKGKVETIIGGLLEVVD